MGDHYRPDRGYEHYAAGQALGGRRYDDRPPPPPPSYAYPDYPPPPPPAYDDPYSYRSGPSNYRGRDHYPHQHHLPPRPGPGDMPQFGQSQRFPDFDFKANPSDTNRTQPQYPTRSSRRNDRQLDYDDTASRRRDQRAQRGNYRGGQRSHQRVGASGRKLLQSMPRERTPPQLEGMNEGKAGTKYAELVSSDEEDDEVEDEDDKQPSQPKWSNPETYTALPPPDESQRKRKDMVKLIRKARVEANQNSESTPENALATNDDFISLAFGDEEEEELIKPAPANAPKGPAADRVNGHTIKGIANKAVIDRTDHPSIESAAVEIDQADSVGARLTSLSLKRKRGVDEEEDDLELRQLRPPSKSLKRPVQPNGQILREWTLQGAASQTAVPWLRPTGKYRIAANARLHQELLDFYQFVGPKRYEQAVRDDLLARLSRFVAEWYDGAKVHIFGSYAAGLYLPDADMDVAVISPLYRSRGVQGIPTSANQLRKLAQQLQRSGFAETTEVIAFARVPIVKFVDRLTSLKVDMSFENETGIVAIDTFQRWKAQFPAMPILVMIVKQFLLMRGLNDVSVGGIGGFSITCLVTSLMQHMPRVQTAELDPMRNLGELLIEFLDYYGNRLNYERVALRMDPPGFMKKADLKRSGQIRKGDPERLMIIDPNASDNDISGGSRHAWLIFSEFAKAKDRILGALEDYNRASDASRFSLLDCVLGGNYDSFLWYRRHLRRVHEDLWGPVNEEDN